MGIFWAIGIALLISWGIGFMMLPQYSPWIHLPLLLALFSFALVLTRRRPETKRQA